MPNLHFQDRHFSEVTLKTYININTFKISYGSKYLKYFLSYFSAISFHASVIKEVFTDIHEMCVSPAFKTHHLFVYSFCLFWSVQILVK